MAKIKKSPSKKQQFVNRLARAIVGNYNEMKNSEESEEELEDKMEDTSFEILRIQKQYLDVQN